MHLEGYGCAGMSATAYGIACRELEAVDSGLRSFVSVQGSLAMYAIHRWGTEEHREEWLPRMATGEVLGCFGLTEPDAGSDPASMRTRAKRDGDDWVLNGSKMWITNGTLGPGSHRRGVAAGVGLGQPEAAERLSRRHPRQPLLLVRVGAPAVDRVHRQRALHGHEAAQPRVDRLELAAGHAVRRRGRPGAAVALQVHAEQAELAELRAEVVGQGALVVPVGDVRGELLRGERAHGVPDRAVLVGQQPVDGQEVVGVGHVGQPTPARPTSTRHFLVPRR